jgi:hypothetical protein
MNPDEFVELVALMRQLQQGFFGGNRSLLGQAKKIEAKVDRFIEEYRGKQGDLFAELPGNPTVQ